MNLQEKSGTEGPNNTDFSEKQFRLENQKPKSTDFFNISPEKMHNYARPHIDNESRKTPVTHTLRLKKESDLKNPQEKETELRIQKRNFDYVPR